MIRDEYVSDIYGYEDTTQFLYNTKIIIQAFGAGESKITCQQVSENGSTVINNSSCYYYHGNKLNSFMINSVGNFTVSLNGNGCSEESIIGYKACEMLGIPVVVILEIPKTSKIDTQTHIKYRTNEAKVIDMFVPQYGQCSMCSANTYIWTHDEPSCSKHLGVISVLRPLHYVTQCHSSFRDESFIYELS